MTIKRIGPHKLVIENPQLVNAMPLLAKTVFTDLFLFPGPYHWFPSHGAGNHLEDYLKETSGIGMGILPSLREAIAFRVSSEFEEDRSASQVTRSVAVHFHEHNRWKTAICDFTPKFGQYSRSSSHREENSFLWETEGLISKGFSRVKEYWQIPIKDVSIQQLIADAKKEERVFESPNYRFCRFTRRTNYGSRKGTSSYGTDNLIIALMGKKLAELYADCLNEKFSGQGSEVVFPKREELDTMGDKHARVCPIILGTMEREGYGLNSGNISCSGLNINRHPTRAVKYKTRNGDFVSNPFYQDEYGRDSVADIRDRA